MLSSKTENEMKIIMDGAEFHDLDVDYYAKLHRGVKRKYTTSGEGQVIRRLKSKPSEHCRWRKERVLRDFICYFNLN